MEAGRPVRTVGRADRPDVTGNDWRANRDPPRPGQAARHRMDVLDEPARGRRVPRGRSSPGLASDPIERSNATRCPGGQPVGRASGRSTPTGAAARSGRGPPFNSCSKPPNRLVGRELADAAGPAATPPGAEDGHAPARAKADAPPTSGPAAVEGGGRRGWLAVDDVSAPHSGQRTLAGRADPVRSYPHRRQSGWSSVRRRRRPRDRRTAANGKGEGERCAKDSIELSFRHGDGAWGVSAWVDGAVAAEAATPRGRAGHGDRLRSADQGEADAELVLAGVVLPIRDLAVAVEVLGRRGTGRRS